MRRARPHPQARQAAWEAAWARRFRQLAALARRRGHLQGPLAPPGSPLAPWIAQQRYLHQQGRLPPERRRRLEALAFPWRSSRPVAASPNFDKAQAFLARHGHLSFPTGHPLMTWANDLRQRARKGRLPQKTRARAERLGVPFTSEDISWERHFANLLSRLARPKSLPLSRHKGPGRWLHLQFECRSHTAKERRQRARLARAGALRPGVVDLETGKQKAQRTYDSRWERSFTQLVRFQKVQGHLRPPPGGMTQALHHWVVRQRKSHAKGQLLPERELRLRRIGFVFDLETEQWETLFARLAAFVAQHGHARVPRLYKADQELARWVAHQRETKATGRLPPAQVTRLTRLGFIWSVHDSLWAEHLARLEAFTKRYGHARVPPRFQEDPSLSIWLASARMRRRTGQLAPDRVRALEALGVAWTAEEIRWQEWVAAYRAFRAEHPNERLNTQNDRGLFTWCEQLRALRSAGKLPPKREAELPALGFDRTEPGAREQEQAETFSAELLAYRKTHGHFWVSAKERPLYDQVQQLRRGHLQLDATARTQLVSHGLPSIPADWLWERRFAALAEYKQRTGHLPSHAEAARWLEEQRELQRRGRHSAEREDRLAELGVFDSAG